MASDVGERQAIFGARHRHMQCLGLRPKCLDARPARRPHRSGARSQELRSPCLVDPRAAGVWSPHAGTQVPLHHKCKYPCLIRYALHRPRWTSKIESETPSSKSIAKILFVLVDDYTFPYIAAFRFIWTKHPTGMISLAHGFARAISTAGTKLSHASTPSRQALIPPAHARPIPLRQIIA